MAQFRFQGLHIWQLAFNIANQLFDIADDLCNNNFFRFSEQLRGAGMSLTNNIAEGSGSTSIKEFQQFPNISRRSVFECANIILTLEYLKLVSPEIRDSLLNDLDILSRKIISFSRTLNKN